MPRYSVKVARYEASCLAMLQGMPSEPAAASPHGRPRSEPARQAVLHAVDDLLVEVGYAAMTMKGIAQRAGVGRQTVYRWWSNKAEILLEASIDDARSELASPPAADPAQDLLNYLDAMSRFLTTSPAGLAYRALLGEAQHDQAVRDLVRDADLVYRSTSEVLNRLRPSSPGMPAARLAVAQLTGPVISTILETGKTLSRDNRARHAALLVSAWNDPG